MTRCNVCGRQVDRGLVICPHCQRPPNYREEHLTRDVIGAARFHGWIVAHFRPAQTSRGRHITAVAGDGKGYPDLTLVRDRLVVAELKLATGRLEPAQQMWRDRLVAAGVEWHLWTAADWFDGRVDEVLRQRGAAAA